MTQPEKSIRTESGTASLSLLAGGSGLSVGWHCGENVGFALPPSVGAGLITAPDVEENVAPSTIASASFARSAPSVSACVCESAGVGLVGLFALLQAATPSATHAPRNAAANACREIVCMVVTPLGFRTRRSPAFTAFDASGRTALTRGVAARCACDAAHMASPRDGRP